MSDKAFVLRLTGKRDSNSIVYTLQNNQNKTSATIRKKMESVIVELFERNLPDPEKEIKPVYDKLSTLTFDMTTKGLQEAAQALGELLSKETPYSNGSLIKVKVLPIAKTDDPWVFMGGQISDTVLDIHGNIHITVEKGKCKYVLTKEQAEGRRVTVPKFIIFNERGDFQLISTSEFDHYFEMAHVH